MGVDRELRSGKRQKVGVTCLDVPPINCQSPDQAPPSKAAVHVKSSKGRMPHHKTHENHSNQNAEKNSQKSGSKIHGKGSKKFRGQTSCNQSNETNGILSIMATCPVGMPYHKTHENHSNHNAEKDSQKSGSKIHGTGSKKFRGQTSCNQSNETDGILSLMVTSPVGMPYHKTHENHSNHNAEKDSQKSGSNIHGAGPKKFRGQTSCNQSNETNGILSIMATSPVGMPYHKTHENHSNHNAEKDSQKSGSKIHGMGSKKFRGQTSCNQSNETNGILSIMAMSPVEKETCIKNDNISDKLFPEHNGKAFNSLLLLKGTNITMPEPGPSPVSNSKKIQTFASSLQEGCKADAHCLDPGTPNEKFSSVDESNNIESKIYHKLKLYLDKRGLPLGPGWKVLVTGSYPKQYSYFISPDNMKFKSMVTVARHLQDTKDVTNKMEDLESREPKRCTGNASVLFNADASQAETAPQNLAMDQVANENYEQDPYPQRIPKGQGFVGQQEDRASTVVQHGLNQSFDEIETWPSSGLSGLGLENTNNIDQNTLYGLRRANGQEDVKEKQQGHWTEVLEQMLKSASMTTSGVRSSICKALSFGPPGCAKEMLEHTILKDDSIRSGAVPMKEALLSLLAWYHGQQIGHGQAERDLSSKRPESVQKGTSTQKEVFMNGTEGKAATEQVISSSDLVTECCRNVFLNITSSEKFAALCNLVHGNFAGSRMHEVFDFRLIDLRMNAGTYGKSPELFALDMQKLWKNVHEIGREMVVLADSLSQHSRDCYQKEVASLLEEEAADSFNMTGKVTVHGHFLDQKDLEGPLQETINKQHNNEYNSKFVQITRHEGCNNCFFTSLRNMQTITHIGRAIKEKDIKGFNDKPKTSSRCLRDETQIVIKNVEDTTNQCLLCEQRVVPSSSTDGCVCRICGVDMNNNCILICDCCEGAYHMYCLSPALEEVPSGSWYCPSCYAAGKESSDNDKKENMAADENTANVVHHCVVCERLANRETFQPSRQADFECDRKENAFYCPRKGAGAKCNGGEFDFDSDRAETEVLDGGQELEFYTDELENGEVCVVCSEAERDDDHFIKCSNVKCNSKFFHMNCVKPPLKTVSSGSWYCPSCLCRICLVDENDECIILCDGCDDGYHIYCLKPRLNSIPSGSWYCPSCLKKYKTKKGKAPCFATNKPFGPVWSMKSKEINPLALGIVRGTKDPSEGGKGCLMQKSVPHARSEKIVQSVTTSSMSAQRVTSVIYGRSLSIGATLAKVVGPKTIGRRKKLRGHKCSES